MSQKHAVCSNAGGELSMMKGVIHTGVPKWAKKSCTTCRHDKVVEKWGREEKCEKISS